VYKELQFVLRTIDTKFPCQAQLAVFFFQIIGGSINELLRLTHSLFNSDKTYLERSPSTESGTSLLCQISLSKPVYVI